MKEKMLSFQETADLCRELALLLHSGIGTGESLFLLAEESEWLAGMGRLVDQGMQLSEAMEKSGRFPAYVPAMVGVGERTGRTEEALQTLADYFEERSRTEKQLRQTLAYPSLLLIMMLAVIGVLLVKVLPVFDSVYASLGSHLTGAAGGLLRLGQLLEAAMPVLLGVLAAAVALTMLYSLWDGFRQRVNAWFQKRFGDRGVFARFHNARFARGLAMGLSSGLPLEEAAVLAQELLQDVPGAAARCGQCVSALESGVSLADAMGAAGFLNASACRMLSAGLRSGSGDRVMERLAGQLTQQANEALEETIQKVEPVMVMAASILVGMILLSVMLPLMDVLRVIG